MVCSVHTAFIIVYVMSQPYALTVHFQFSKNQHEFTYQCLDMALVLHIKLSKTAIIEHGIITGLREWGVSTLVNV